MRRRARPRHEIARRKPSDWFEVARRAAGALPGVTGHASAAGPVFRIGRRRLAWLAQDGVSPVVGIAEDEQDMLVTAEPRTFSVEQAAGARWCASISPPPIPAPWHASSRKRLSP